MQLTATLSALAAAAPFVLASGPPPAVQEEAEEAAPVLGTATGKVAFVGDVPELKPLKVEVDKAKGCCPPGEEVDPTDRSLLLDEEGGIQNVVLTLRVPGVEVEVPEEPYEMDQVGCRFEPHVLVVPRGAKVAFLNSDAASHNVHTVSILNDVVNQTVLEGKHLEVDMDQAERVKVTCDMHTWMSAWVVVTDATHWTKTAADGSFSIEGLPPGRYELTAWHEVLGTAKAPVVIDEEGASEPVRLGMEPKKRKPRRRRR